MAVASRSQTKPQPRWLAQLVKADALMEKRCAAYERTLGNPNALIASPEWERFAFAIARRDAIRERHWRELLDLACAGAGWVE